MTFEQLMAQYFPTVRKQYIGGSDGDPGEDMWIDSSGRDLQMGATGLDTWNSMFDQMASAPSGLNLSPERRMQILEQMARNSPTSAVNINQMGQYLTPQENQALQQWNQWAQNENNSMSFGDYLARGAFAAGLAGMGGLAFGGMGAPAGVDAAWGVNPAASEFSLAGGTAGNASGGLYSGAGGVTGLTPGGLGVTGVTGAGSAGSLLTPAMAASMGLPASAAMGGSGLTAAQLMGGVSDASWGANAASSLGKLFSGDAGASDYLKLGGNLLGAGLGAVGASKQADAYGDVANKFMDMGAPYRGLLAQSYQPGFSMANQPDFMNALDVGSQAAARATSAKSGNPVQNPGAYAEMQKYISGSLALPQLNTYRSQLGTFGQLGTSQAGQAMGNQVQSQGGVYDALGYGIGQATQPENPLKGLLDQFKGFNINPARSY